MKSIQQLHCYIIGMTSLAKDMLNVYVGMDTIWETLYYE